MDYSYKDEVGLPMTELDLSLLTDEERVLWDFCSSRPKEQTVIIPAEMLDVLRALIAARAENKRLQDGTKEVLSDVEFSINHSDDLGRKNTLNIAQEKLRALLATQERE